MRKLFLLAVVCTFWLTFTESAAADIIYHVDDHVGAGSVTGDITTNGTIGTLFNGDILSFDLTLNDPSGTADLCMGTTCPTGATAGTVFIGGGSLIASTSQLMFDFNSSGAFVNFFPAIGALCPPAWNLHTDGGSTCTTGGGGDVDALSAALPAGSGIFSPESGMLTIAPTSTVIPEPGSVGLMVAGLVSLIGLCKRRF